MLTEAQFYPRAEIRRLAQRQSIPSRQRVLLVTVSLLLFAVPLLVFDLAAYWADDPELFRLLRGMGVLKIALAVAALAVVFWRLGGVVQPRLRAVYLGGVWALSLAAGMIWQLHWILPASGLFHGATIALLIAAWRDMEPHLPSRHAPVRARAIGRSAPK